MIRPNRFRIQSAACDSSLSPGKAGFAGQIKSRATMLERGILFCALWLALVTHSATTRGQWQTSESANAIASAPELAALPAVSQPQESLGRDIEPCAFQSDALKSQPDTPNPWTALLQATSDSPQLDNPNWNPPPAAAKPCVTDDAPSAQDTWQWQVMPHGIIYQSYMAGTKEPRFASYFNQNSAMGDMWDVALGARIGLLRYGNDDPNWPEGWQLDMEGGVFPRLDPDGESTPLIGDDYRFGIPLTYGGDRWEFKVGYYHISAHLGDEFIIQNPSQAAARINYVRDGLILGAGYFLKPELRLYGEVGVAAVDGGAKPMEFQFGGEWAQARDTGVRGGPFAAVNGDLRQEVDYGGNVTVQFGWMWRKYARGSNFRIGGQYFYGKSDEYEFFKQTESRVGWGLWCDF